MIPMEQLEKRARAIHDDIGHALVYVDGQAVDGVIKKVTLNGNGVKVFVALSSINGMIERVEVYDKDGDLLQTQAMQILKDDHYKFMAVIEIRVEGADIYGH